MKVNLGKTKLIKISKNWSRDSSNIKTGVDPPPSNIQEVDEFNQFGSIIIKYGWNKNDMKRRLKQADQAIKRKVCFN